MQSALRVGTALLGDAALAELAVFGAATAAITAPITTGALAYNKSKSYRHKRDINWELQGRPQKRQRRGNYDRMSYRPRDLFQAARSRRSRYRSQLGRKPGKYSTRRHQAGATISNVPDKSKNSIRLMQVPYNADENVINTRKASLVKVKGVKFRAWFKFTSAATAGPDSQIYKEPLQIRWALLNPKNNDGQPTVSDVDFLITANPTADQATNFPTSGRSFSYMSRKINREQFGVLKEGSFILNPGAELAKATSTGAGIPLSGHKFINLYVPVNRQMKWVDDAATHPEHNIYFVYWYTTLGDERAPVKFQVADNPLTCSYEHITYFTNSRMYV